MKLQGLSRLWVGSGTEKCLPVFKVKIAVDDVEGSIDIPRLENAMRDGLIILTMSWISQII